MSKTKTLSERVAERMIKKRPTRGAQNRATFLALRPDIKQAIDDGWPVKSIWETLNEEGKITFSYQAFCRYTKRLILTPPTSQAPPIPNSTAAAPDKKTKVVNKPTPAVNAGFTFNSEPNKQDLF